MIGGTARLLAFALPLCLDTFAISASVGVAGLPAAKRVRLSLVFVLFEGGMPLIGVLVGGPISTLAGRWADYAAAALLIGLGAWTLWERSDEEEGRAGRLAAAGGLALIGLGLSVSIDELAIGFSLGLLHLPVAGAVVLIAVEALVASQAGFLLGARIGERVREGAERLAGVALVVLGLLLAGLRLAGIG